ncbi:MAG: tetratricopeptide repeat protein [Deltaproteobacteria bacterium]|jgi:hypothetical protein|nr:tetratricopeptide repeat protein [Deltaproteobacteria bacterium]
MSDKTAETVCPGCGAPLRAPEEGVPSELTCVKCGTVIPNPNAERTDPEILSARALAADITAETALVRAGGRDDPPPPPAAEPPEAGDGEAPSGEAETARPAAPGTLREGADGPPPEGPPEAVPVESAGPGGMGGGTGLPQAPETEAASGAPETPREPAEDLIQAELGATALQRSDLDAAERHFRRAAELNPDSYAAWKGLADCILHRPADGRFKSLRMIDFLKSDIEPDFIESALPPSVRGMNVYCRHAKTGALLVGTGLSAARRDRLGPETVTAVALGGSIHRYAYFRHSGPKLAAGRGRAVLRDWAAFRDSFSAQLAPLRERIVNAARLAPKGHEAELMVEYAYRFIDRPMMMANACAGGERRSPDKRCFIAAAVYGSPDAPEVMALRAFRDRALAPSLPGRLAVRAYLALSPFAARRIERSVALRRLARLALDAIVRRLPA